MISHPAPCGVPAQTIAAAARDLQGAIAVQFRRSPKVRLPVRPRRSVLNEIADLQEFALWCEARKIKPDGPSRALFAIEKHASQQTGHA
jgi:hypothetical protein